MLVPGLAEPGVMPAAAIAILAMLTAINASGVRKVGGLAIVTVAVRVLPLFAIAALALLLPAGSRIAAATTAAPVSLANLSVATSLTFFALMGFEAVLTPVGKIREPQRTIPRAIFFATVFTAALYFVATQSLAVILTPAAIEQSASPFADAIGRHWGVIASALATLAIAVSAFGCLSASVLGVGEMLYSMALRGEVPALFTKVNKRDVPINALIVGNGFVLGGRASNQQLGVHGQGLAAILALADLELLTGHPPRTLTLSDHARQRAASWPVDEAGPRLFVVRACPSCGEEASEQARFCPACGMALAPATSAPSGVYGRS